MRYAVPVAVVGVAAVTIGLVPALADTGDPDLPKLTAQQLIEKMAASDVEQHTGTVQITTDLGLPDLGGLADLVPGADGASGAGRGTSGSGSSAADPSSKLMELVSGTHTLRVATDGPDRQKLSFLEKSAEYTMIHNGDQLWMYDSAAKEAYHVTQKQGREEDRGGRERGDDGLKAPTPEELARESLKASRDTTSVTVDGTGRVAGRDAYRLVIKPKQSGSTVGAISIAVDAKNFTPLKFTLTPASGGSAVVDVGYVKVDFAEPPASTFTFTPPKGTKVTEGDGAPRTGQREKGLPGPASGLEGLLPGSGSAGKHGTDAEPKVIGKGWSAIAEFGGDGAGGSGSGSSGELSQDAEGLLGSLGDRTHGAFGSGTLFSTRLVNALVTDDGRMYAGMVTKKALMKAANGEH